VQALAAINPSRFFAPTWAEEADDAAEAREQQARHEQSKERALTAMVAGLPGLVVDKHTSGAQTLADMLSEHTCNYRVDVQAPSPCDLLAVMLAEALRRKCPAAEAHAARVALDYAITHEVA
jgi:hypothetical protein